MSTVASALRAMVVVGSVLASLAQTPELPVVKADGPAIVPSLRQHVIIIRDGTAVEMRFAQAVVGTGSNARRDASDSDTAQADPGDKIRLVAAADVRVNHVVVVAKGSIAQATVTEMKSTLRSFSSGIGIRLDWIEDVNGGKIPLRISATGPGHSALIVVRRTPAGVVAAPESTGKVHLLTGEFRNAGKESIPVGTRMFGYVRGDQSLDTSTIPDTAVTKAPTVTIYQTKDHANGRFEVECDGRQVGEIAPEQYLVFDLAPGQHTCQLHKHQQLAFGVEAGAEYFFRILPKDGTLENVTVGEGEDGVAGLEAVKLLQGNN